MVPRKDVMGPDEFAFPVNNSAYTNAVINIALSFATEAVRFHSRTVLYFE